jgi:hypothetical protein
VVFRGFKVFVHSLLNVFLIIGVLAPSAVLAERFESGAYIINFGTEPQSVANALEPYGMVFDLVSNAIPVH